MNQTTPSWRTSAYVIALSTLLATLLACGDGLVIESVEEISIQVSAGCASTSTVSTSM